MRAHRFRSLVTASLICGLTACSSYTATVLRDVEAVEDGCGNVVVRAHAHAGEKHLRVFADGVEQRRFTVDGDLHIEEVIGAVASGTVEVTLTNGALAPLRRIVDIDARPEAPGLVLEPTERRLFEGEASGVQLRVDCTGANTFDWTGGIDDQTPQSGTTVAANPTAFLPTGQLPHGSHTVYANAVLSPSRTDGAVLDIYVYPPCEDADGDGMSTCAGDCDDADPSQTRCAPSDDLDGDGHVGAAFGGPDCNDLRSDVHPGHADGEDADGDGVSVADHRDNDCDGQIDEESKHHVPMSDCNDADREMHPMQNEYSVADGKDNDCDGLVDEDTPAFDHDGDGASVLEGDCDDTDPMTGPHAVERDNCLDDDCDGAIDEGFDIDHREDRFEPNDTQASAYDLSVDPDTTTLMVNPRDADDEEWFRFSLSSGGFLAVTLTHPAPGARFDVTVYNERGYAVQTARLSEHRRRSRAIRMSGAYTMKVVPVDLTQSHCPSTFSIH